MLSNLVLLFNNRKISSVGRNWSDNAKVATMIAYSGTNINNTHRFLRRNRFLDMAKNHSSDVMSSKVRYLS